MRNRNKRGWNLQAAQILREERDGEFIFKENMLSRVPKPVELSHEWFLNISSIRSQNVSLEYLMSKKKTLFEVPAGHKKFDEIRKSISGAPKLYILHEIKSACVFFSVS